VLIFQTLQTQTKEYPAMKKIFAILFIGTIFAACNQTTLTKETSIDLGAVKTIELHVTGMTCEGCENSVMEAVNEVDGVTEVAASYTKELTTISYDTTLTDISKLSAVIDNLGYKVEGLAQHSEPEE
jgi:copper chaperone CopZ